jgi:hypothetical protein
VQTYITNNEVVNQPKQVPSGCNSIIFYNQGLCNVIIDQLILTPGSSWSIDGNKDEINVTNYNIQFSDLGSNPSLLITRKIVNF